DAASDKIVSLSARNEVATRDVPKDPAITAIIEKYRPAALRVANRPIGSITSEITRTNNVAGESALGDLVADAQLASVSAPDKGGAVIGLMNAGGIRANLTGTARSNNAREISYGDLYNVQPFGNQVTVRTMTGDMLRRLLEQQVEIAPPGLMLQVSEGFTFQ